MTIMSAASASASATSAIQECTPAPESVRQRRRQSLGNRLLKRASSLGRLMNRQGSKRSVSTADESTTHYDEPDSSEHPETSTSSSFDPALLDVVQALKANVVKLKKVEAIIANQVQSNRNLALARYTGGNPNQTGAVLSMRKVHKNEWVLGHTMQARVQFHQHRQQLKTALRQGYFAGLQVDHERKQIRAVWRRLQQHQVQYTTPTDDELLAQLEDYMQQGVEVSGN